MMVYLFKICTDLILWDKNQQVLGVEFEGFFSKTNLAVDQFWPMIS